MSVSPFEDKYSVTIERHIAWSPQLSLLSLSSLNTHTQQIINPSCFLATNQGNGCKRCSRLTAYIPPPCHKNAQGPHIHISGMGSSYCLSYKWLTSLHKLRCANCVTKLLFFFQNHQAFRSRIEKLLLSRNVYLLFIALRLMQKP